MASLNLKSFARLVEDQAAAIQAACAALIDFTTGSIERAVIEANASIGIWLESLIVAVLRISRLTTSTGNDVDTFLAQFGLTRLVANAAVGLVTFGRLSAASSITLVPIGGLVRTADGSQTFVVTADPTNPAYSATLSGYVIPAGALSIAAPVAALTVGSVGNVGAGTISTVASQMPGVDFVNNVGAFTTGSDAESDAAAQARFVLFIGSLSKGTVSAYQYAVASLGQGLQLTIHENVDAGGAVDLGMVTMFVDDGSGAPPATLVQAALVACNAVHAAGIRIGVYAATLLAASIAATITTASGFDHPTVVAQVEAAMAAYVDALGLEAMLPVSRLYAVAYGVLGVTDVTGLSVNGAATDIVPGFGQTIKATQVTVS